MVLSRLRPTWRTPTPPKISKLLVATLVLGVLSLFVERIPDPGIFVAIAIHIVDFAIFLLLTVEIVQDFRRSRGFRSLLRNEPFNTAFYAVFTALFVIHKTLTFTGGDFAVESLPAVLVILRNIFIVLKILGRVRKLAAFLRSITSHPA
jgi:trk system potassium uptake protein TrkH